MKKPRNKIKNPNLIKKYNSRVRQEYIDMDYLDQLSEEDLAWMNQFMGEYNNASFNNDETDLDQSIEGKKASYDRNNARNRCLFGQVKSKVANTNLLNYENVVNMVEEEMARDINPANVENAYIDFLDSKQVDAMLAEYDAAMALFNENEILG